MELRLGGTLASALTAPHYTVTAVGSGGLAVPVATGEMHDLDDAGVRGVVRASNAAGDGEVEEGRP